MAAGDMQVKPQRPRKHRAKSQPNDLAAKVIRIGQQAQQRISDLRSGFRSTNTDRAPHCIGADPDKSAREICRIEQRLVRMLAAADP